MILQIVGLKNSGKTTLVQHSVKLLKEHHYMVATIKHHGHQSEHDITLQQSNVDHMKHFDAGADQSIVQGYEYQQSVTRTAKQSLDEIITQSVTIDSNIILVEGFKEADFDKVLVYRTESDKNTLADLENVKYYINIDNQDALASYDEWLLSFVNKKE